MGWSKGMGRAIGAVLISTALAIAGCGGGGGGGGGSNPGVLSGTVYDASSATAIPGATVTVYDANTNSAVGSLTTDSNGAYSAYLTSGNYYIKVTMQGYNPVPQSEFTPVAFSVKAAVITADDVQMTPASNTNTGWITGTVAANGAGVAGVLVVASSSGGAFSAVTDSNGAYVINNVPVATYSVTGFRMGYSATTDSSVSVAQGVGTTGVDLALTGASGQVPVSFNVIAATGVTPPATMLVSLIHPLTHETIPGLALTQSYAPSINYNFTGVADGTYLVRATYANDTIVVDPDAIRKFGEPSTTVATGVTTPVVNIDATSAVGLISPTNAMNTTAPVSVSGATAPVLSWHAYPSTTDYVVEMTDAATGSVIWGGFSNGGTTKVVYTTNTSITYGGPALQSGHVYRWRVYASKNDTTGWHLISASEDQQGLITVP